MIDFLTPIQEPDATNYDFDLVIALELEAKFDELEDLVKSSKIDS